VITDNLCGPESIKYLTLSFLSGAFFLHKSAYVFLPYAVLAVLLISLAFVPGYNAAPTGSSPQGASYYYYYLFTPITTSTAATCTDGLQIAASYDRNTGYLRFEGWRFTPSGMVTGYIDGEPTWDTGLVGFDGHVWGSFLISLSPTQHTVYLVDLSTGKQSCTVTVG